MGAKERHLLCVTQDAETFVFGSHLLSDNSAILADIVSDLDRLSFVHSFEVTKLPTHILVELTLN
jgi:hypothetical protein